MVEFGSHLLEPNINLLGAMKKFIPSHAWRTPLRDAIGMQSGWAYDAEPPAPLRPATQDE